MICVAGRLCFRGSEKENSSDDYRRAKEQNDQQLFRESTSLDVVKSLQHSTAHHSEEGEGEGEGVGVSHSRPSAAPSIPPRSPKASRAAVHSPRSKRRTKSRISDDGAIETCSKQYANASDATECNFTASSDSDVGSVDSAWRLQSLIETSNRPAPKLPPRLPLSKGQSNLFASMSELLQKNAGWYWGPLRMGEAERLLKGRPDGCFLMRDSSSLNHVFSISGKVHSKIVNIRIEYLNNEFRLMANDFQGCDSLIELIDKTLQLTGRGNYCFVMQRKPGVAPLAMSLQSYVSRKEVVPSLKYLSRLKIHQTCNDVNHALSLVDALPVPETLSDYVKRCPFYDSSLVDAVVNNWARVAPTEAQLSPTDS